MEREEQRLDADERELLERALRLFEEFRTAHRPMHEQARVGRQLRALKDDTLPKTAPKLNNLNSTIDNVIADQLDNLPEAKMLPERPELQDSADILTDVVRYALYQSAFDEQYAEVMEDCAVTGTGVLQVFWDEALDDGRGMARCERWEMESFCPDPLFEDIQDGRAVFKTAFYPREWFEEHYPDKAQYIGGDAFWEPRTAYSPEGEAPILLIEYWWRDYDAASKRYRVHMAQVAGGALLYYSGEQSVYSHGKYPFVVFRYRKQAGSPFGISLMDDYADQWRATCRYAKYVDDNARASSRQRFIYREDSGLDGKALADWSKDFIGTRGNIDDASLRSFQASPLNPQVMNFMTYLVDTMKQDSGQNQFSRGEGGLGVTAASAIQALQEAGGKITRLHTASYKECFRQVVEQMIYILSDKITTERVIMVAGRSSSGELIPRNVKLVPGKGRAIERPPYNVRVQVQRRSPLQIQANNEFVMQVAQICGQAGQPLPPIAVVSLLQGIDNKQEVLTALHESDQMRAQMQQMQQAIEQMQAQLQQAGQQQEALRQALQAGQQEAPDYGGLEETVTQEPQGGQ